MIAINKYNNKHPLRVFEAFAGYGSQSLAFKYLKDKHPEFDFKVVGYSEIEPSAIQAYGLLHGRDIPNFGDVTRIDWKTTYLPNISYPSPFSKSISPKQTSMNQSKNSTQKIAIPKTADGCSPTITSSFGAGISIANLLGVDHFPKGGVLIIKKLQAENSSSTQT